MTDVPWSAGEETPDGSGAHVPGTALAAADIGYFELRFDHGQVFVDQRMADLLGLRPEEQVETVDDFLARIHPADVAGAQRALEEARDRHGPYLVEYRVRLPGGGTRWISERGRVLTDPDGAARRLVGVGFDSTAQRSSRDQVSHLMETMTSGFYRLDRDWRFRYVNAQAEQLIRRGREELLGRRIWDEFPRLAPTRMAQEYHRAVATGDEVSFEQYYPPFKRWYDVRASPDDDGLSVFFVDVTERHRAFERLSLLAEASRVLVGSQDIDEICEALVGVLVENLADLAVISLFDETGRLGTTRAGHSDPTHAAELRVLERLHPRLVTEAEPIVAAISSGEPQLIGLADGPRAGDDRPFLATLDRLGYDSVLIVPLRARGRAVGVLTLANARHTEPLNDGTISTAVALADRTGLAIENAQLYRRQRHTAEILQHSLLTPLPQPDDLELAARYVPADDGAQVGGDWYDAFTQPDGATILVIGDVVGHDITAAATMGQLRNLLRGLAHATPDSTNELLEHLDGALRDLAVPALATLLVGRMEQTPEQRRRGERTFRWSSAGHPPPLLLRADRAVEVLATPNDLMIGFDPAARRTDRAVVLHPGDTLLLYTDGLVEHRERPLDRGIAELVDVLGAVQEESLEAVCDALLAALVPSARADDVALLVVRPRAQETHHPAAARDGRTTGPAPAD